jgi:nuclear transport factor 2 (NTF2) superfamily protein
MTKQTTLESRRAENDLYLSVQSCTDRYKVRAIRGDSDERRTFIASLFAVALTLPAIAKVTTTKGNSMPRPPVPPFTLETAIQKVRLAEDGWNSRDAAKVALAYTVDTRWRNRVEFATNREQAQAFLERKWNKEHGYRLIKELWAFTGNRIAVRYAYEYHDDNGHWFRAYGNENWQFAEDGLMSNRHASINEMPIKEADRLFHWPLGRRPDDHASLSDLGL